MIDEDCIAQMCKNIESCDMENFTSELLDWYKTAQNDAVKDTLSEVFELLFYYCWTGGL